MTPGRHPELGTIDAPLFVFGGPYSNLQATEAVLAVASALGIPADRTICTGDVVAYGAHPRETVSAVRDAGIHVVMGNCEESLGEDRDDCGCGFAEVSACDVLSRRWYAHARRALGESDRAWMRGLPRRVYATLAGRRLAFVHGSPGAVAGWVFETTAEGEKRGELDAAEADAVVGGHTGIPFAQRLGDGRLWLNAGVIGLPANDGTTRGWYAVLTPVDGAGIDIEIGAFDYDSRAAAAAMRSAGLPEAYARSLEDGLWPNMDVLPPGERARRGRPIEPRVLRWPDAG